MLRLTALISWMTFMPLAAQANTTMISLASSTCSGAMSISSLAGASLSCAGNLSLNGGLIESDASIFIHAAGDLLLENINLNAPEISISTISGNLQMAGTVHIKAAQNEGNGGGQVMIGMLPIKQDIHWNSFNIGLNQGGNIQFTVPNSSSSVLNRITESGKINVLNITGILSNASSVNLTTAGLSVVSNQISVASVPEANTSAMLLLGMGLLALRRKHAR
jgi:filamentous hemagglutinin family protein